MPFTKVRRLAVLALLLGLFRGSGLEQAPEQVQQLLRDDAATSTSSMGAVEKAGEELLQQRIIVALEGEVRALKRVAELEEEVKHLKSKLVECDGKLNRCEAAGTVVLDRRVPPAATNVALAANLTAAAVAGSASEEDDFDMLSSLPEANSTKHSRSSSTVDGFVNDFASALIPMVLGVLAYGVLTARFSHGERLKNVLGSSAEGALRVSRGARSIALPREASGSCPDDGDKLGKARQNTDDPPTERKASGSCPDDGDKLGKAQQNTDHPPTERKLYEPKWNQSLQKKDDQSQDSSPGIASTTASQSPTFLDDPGKGSAWTPETKCASLEEPQLPVQMDDAPGLLMSTSFLHGPPPGLIPPPPGLPPPGPPPGLTGLAPASLGFLAEGGHLEAPPSALPPACPQGEVEVHAELRLSQDFEDVSDVNGKCVSQEEQQPPIEEEKAAAAPQGEAEEHQENLEEEDEEDEQGEAVEEEQEEQEEEEQEEDEDDVQEEGGNYEEEEAQKIWEKETWQKTRQKVTANSAARDRLPDGKRSIKGKDRKKQAKEHKEPKLMKKKASQASEGRSDSWLRAARSFVTTPFGLALTSMLGVTLLGRVVSPTCQQILPFNTKSEGAPERGGASSDRCASHVPDHVTILEGGSELPEPKDVKPAIALHARCFLNIFHGVAKKYRPTGTWYWVKDLKRPRVEIRHPYEESRKLSNPRDNTTIINFLTDNIFPMFGQVNQITYEWYSMQHDAGLVMLLADPAKHASLEEAQAHWRPTFQALHETFLLKYFMTFAPTFDQQDQDWLRMEFGVKTFPALVVQDHRAGAARYVYSGDMSQANLLQFIQDVDEGCLNWKHPRLTFAGLRPIPEREAPRCMLPEEEGESHDRSRAAADTAEAEMIDTAGGEDDAMEL